MTKNREIRALSRREGYLVKFLERGGKFRLDFVAAEEREGAGGKKERGLEELEKGNDRKKKNMGRLGLHFWALMKIVLRGRGGGAKERFMAIVATLYFYGKIEMGEKVRMSREILVDWEDEAGILAEDVVEEGMRELMEVEESLAMIYGEERVIGENEFEIMDDWVEDVRRFEGVGREEFEGRCAEGWFYEKILAPVVEEIGGKRSDILDQVDFSGLVAWEDEGNEEKFEKKEEKIDGVDGEEGRAEKNRMERELRGRRRVDFFLSDGEKEMVLEVDDETHEASGKGESDEARDRVLRGNRIRVFRVRVEELKEVEKVKKRLKRALKGFYTSGGRDVLEEEEYARGDIEGRSRKGLGRILVGEEEILYQEVNVRGELVAWTGEGFLYKRWRVRDCKETREEVRKLVKYLFGFEKLREGQEEGIMRGLMRKDTILLLPTGAGKSLVYQFLALVLPGMVMVVEPLRALMEDQVENLQKRGIDLVVNLSADIKLREKQRLFELVARGAFALVYATPERMQMLEFRRMVFRAKVRGVFFSALVLDEAHCVSEWGHDFRVAYLNLAETGRKLLEFYGREPVLIGLTGTASWRVLLDMRRDLRVLEKGVVRPKSFDRPEIEFRVVKVKNDEKFGELCRVLKRVEGRGIVFCVYKSESSEFGVEAVYQRLCERFPERKIVQYYGAEEKTEMRENMRKFREGEAELIVATKAFGMGIDMKNIDFVVHLGIPNSVEAYYQEVGRAGRGALRARGWVILSDDFPERNRKLLTEVTLGQMKGRLLSLNMKTRDDVTRLLYLHSGDFSKKRLMQTTGRVLGELGRLSRVREKERRIVARGRAEFREFQKVLFRLKMFGVVEDYMVSGYANREFLVLCREFNEERILAEFRKYLGRYKKVVKEDFGDLSGEKLLLALMGEAFEVIDEEVEKKRRLAILEMLELAERVSKREGIAEQDEAMRQGILRYFDKGEEKKEIFVEEDIGKFFLKRGTGEGDSEKEESLEDRVRRIEERVDAIWQKVKSVIE